MPKSESSNTDDLSEVMASERSLTGKLVVRFDEAWIEMSSSGEVVEVKDPTLCSRLLEAVPCYVGGPNLYADDATVVGTFSSSGGTSTIKVVRTVTLWRDGETYQI